VGEFGEIGELGMGVEDEVSEGGGREEAEAGEIHVLDMGPVEAVVDEVGVELHPHHVVYLPPVDVLQHHQEVITDHHCLLPQLQAQRVPREHAALVHSLHHHLLPATNLHSHLQLRSPPLHHHLLRQ